MKLLPLLLLCMALQGATLSYWVEPCVHPQSGCKRDDPELAQWAMEAWQAASGGALHLVKVQDREQGIGDVLTDYRPTPRAERSASGGSECPASAAGRRSGCIRG